MTQSLADTISESDTDYNTGRFNSAARGFEHVADTMSEDEMSDAMYFYYRALQSYAEMGDLIEQSRILNKISGFCLNHSLRILSLQMNSEDNKISVMDRSQMIMKKQDKHEERRSLLSTLIETIDTEMDTELEFEQRLNLGDKLLKFSNELLDMDKLNAAKSKVAQLILEEYKDRLDNISEHNLVIVGDRMLRSAQLFSELGDNNQSNKILEMIKEFDLPESVISDYEITGKDIVFIHADDVMGENFESGLLQVLIEQIKVIKETENYFVIITSRTMQIDLPYYLDYLKQINRIIEIPRGVDENRFIEELIKNANAILISNTFESEQVAWLDTVKKAYIFDPSTNKYIIDVGEIN